jgi:hypothetical protein
MYHSFPRRRAGDADGRKGLTILELIATHGLLLTPEVERWRDSKLPPSPPEDYVVVSKRCCFTELAEHELPKHAKYFGEFALEFDVRILCDLGAMPVFYIPRMSNGQGYGVGPAIVTQLAHVQDMLVRLSAFRQFAAHAGAAHPSGPIWAYQAHDGGLLLQVPGTTLTCTVPGDIVERAKKANPSFIAPTIPSTGVPFGLTAGTLLNLFNILSWGLHEPDVLTGTVKALGSLFYSTERSEDPFLSHYQQREWRIIGGVKKDNVPVTRPVSPELRTRLLDLDASFFDREVDLHSGRARLVDQCEVFFSKPTGEPLMSFVRRVVTPAKRKEDVRAVLRGFDQIEIVELEQFEDAVTYRRSFCVGVLAWVKRRLTCRDTKEFRD